MNEENKKEELKLGDNDILTETDVTEKEDDMDQPTIPNINQIVTTQDYSFKRSVFVIVYKLTSGKFLLTIVASICFLIIVKEIMGILKTRSEEIDSGQILLIITNLSLVIQNVFQSYFARKKEEGIDTSGQ